MRYYTAIVNHDEGGAFGLTFPDLPGAFASADTWEKIPKAAAEALDLWFEDQPDVAPASLDAIRKREDVVEGLAAGAALMLVPYIPADTATERADTLPRSLLRAMDETAPPHHAGSEAEGYRTGVAGAPRIIPR